MEIQQSSLTSRLSRQWYLGFTIFDTQQLVGGSLSLAAGRSLDCLTDFRCVSTCWRSMEFNGHAAAASLGGDIMVSGYLKTDCSDPSPRNEEGLPSAFLSSPSTPPPFLSHPPLTSPSYALLFHTLLLSFNSFNFSPLFCHFLRRNNAETFLVSCDFRAKLFPIILLTKGCCWKGMGTTKSTKKLGEMKSRCSNKNKNNKILSFVCRAELVAKSHTGQILKRFCFRQFGWSLHHN